MVTVRRSDISVVRVTCGAACHPSEKRRDAMSADSDGLLNEFWTPDVRGHTAHIKQSTSAAALHGRHVIAAETPSHIRSLARVSKGDWGDSMVSSRNENDSVPSAPFQKG